MGNHEYETSLLTAVENMFASPKVWDLLELVVSQAECVR